MKRRTREALVTLLEWGGYGLGYSEKAPQPSLSSPSPPAAPGATELLAPEEDFRGQGLPFRPAPLGSPARDEPPPSTEPPREATAPAGSRNDGAQWTDLFTLSTTRRLHAWRELELALVDEWDAWTAPKVAAWSRRRAAWTQDLQAWRADLRGLTEAPRAHWAALRRAGHSYRAWVTKWDRRQPPARPVIEAHLPAVQRSRNTRALARAAVEREAPDADGQRPEPVPPDASEMQPGIGHTLSRLGERLEDFHNRRVFTDAWSLDEKDVVPEAEPTAPETPAPAVERLERMLARKAGSDNLSS